MMSLKPQIAVTALAHSRTDIPDVYSCLKPSVTSSSLLPLSKCSCYRPELVRAIVEKKCNCTEITEIFCIVLL